LYYHNAWFRNGIYCGYKYKFIRL